MGALLVLALLAPNDLTGCAVEPFLLGEELALPLPGVRDGVLVFESAPICSALPALTPIQSSAEAINALEVRGRAVEHAVAVGRGLNVPGEAIDCRWRRDNGQAEPSFVGGNIQPGAWRQAYDMNASFAAYWFAGTPAAREAEAIVGARCWPAYRQALLDTVLAPGPRGDAAHLRFEAAIASSGTCVTDFRSVFEALVSRQAYLSISPRHRWARVGACWMRGVPWPGQTRQTFAMRCPDRFHATLTIEAEVLPAFIGANDPALVGAVHPMDPWCRLDGP